MYGIFTYVWAIFWGKCRYIFQHHGAFGYYKHPFLEFYQNLVIPSKLLNSKSLREKLTLRDDRCDGSVPAMVQCHGFPMWARAQSAWMETKNPDHQPKILHSNPQKEEGCRTVKSLKIVVSECKCSFRSCLHLFTLPQTSIPIRCMWGALNLSPTRAAADVNQKALFLLDVYRPFVRASQAPQRLLRDDNSKKIPSWMRQNL